MTEALNWTIRAFLFSGFFISTTFIIYSAFEKEKSAALKMLPVSLFFSATLTFSFYTVFSVIVQFILLIIFVVVAGVLIIPFSNKKIKYSTSGKQFDERDIMFSRMELEDGTPKFDD